MSVIRRIEVINFLNHRKESADWNPWYRHEIIIFEGFSGVLQMPNGKGKTTLAEAIAALVTRDRRRLDVAQGRMAFRGHQMSHFRIELLREPRKDLVGIGGDPWVIGMAGNNVGPITFYTYHGTLEDAPIVRKYTSDEMVLAPLEELERLVKAKPEGERRWNADETEWRTRLVGNRHLPLAALNEMARLQGMGGAEKAVRFFDIKAKEERFDEAFFFNQIAPDLMDDLMTSEGEEEERRAAARRGQRYQPDNTFDKMVVNTLRSVTDTRYAIDNRAEIIANWKKVADGLRSACVHAQDVKGRQERVEEIRNELSANVTAWRWLARNMAAWPSADMPGGLLGQLCTHLGILPGGAVVVRDSGMAYLLGREVHHANQMLSARKGVASPDGTKTSQLIEIACDLDVEGGRRWSGVDTRKWYPADEALRGLRMATSFGHGLNAEAAATMLSTAIEWAQTSYFQANPLAERVHQFQVELATKKAALAEYEGRLRDRRDAAQRRLVDSGRKRKELEDEIKEPLRQLEDLQRFRRECPDADPVLEAENLSRLLETTILKKTQLENRQKELEDQLEGLEKRQIVPDRFSNTIHEKLRAASVSFSTVLHVLQASRSALEAAGRWEPVVRTFANLLFAPVVDTADMGKRASLALDKASLSFPVFVRGNLMAAIEHDEITSLSDLTYAHLAWGGAETATIRAFTNPSETEDLQKQIAEEQVATAEALAELDSVSNIQARLQRASLAAKAIEADAEAVVFDNRCQIEEHEQIFKAAEREAGAIGSILACDEIPLGGELAVLYPIARGYWDKEKAIRDLLEKRQPWATGADDIHALAADAQRRFKKVLRVEHEFGLLAISLDADREPSLQAANRLKDAVSKCLREGFPVKDAVSAMRAGIENLDTTELRSNLLQATDSVNHATSTMHLAVSAALKGDTSLTDMQRDALEEEAQTPDGLLTAVARFGENIKSETETNQRSKNSVESMEKRAIDFLVGMVSEVRRRLRLLQVALTEGEGATFLVECTLPNKDALQRVFVDLMDDVRRVDRGAQADLGPNASADEVRRLADRTLRKVVREKTKRKILISPSVQVSHSAISGGEPVFLQDPDPNNPNRFSGGENTAISIAWIIRRAKYAIQREALRNRQASAPASSFIILDGLFSDLSDKDLTREAMAPLKTLGGQFQIIALVHPPEYLMKHDVEIFPVLNIGRVHGDGWKMLHFDADHWDPNWVIKEGTIGVSHFSVLPADRIPPKKDQPPRQGDAP